MQQQAHVCQTWSDLLSSGSNNFCSVLSAFLRNAGHMLTFSPSISRGLSSSTSAGERHRRRHNKNRGSLEPTFLSFGKTNAINLGSVPASAGKPLEKLDPNSTRLGVRLLANSLVTELCFADAAISDSEVAGINGAKRRHKSQASRRRCHEDGAGASGRFQRDLCLRTRTHPLFYRGGGSYLTEFYLY